jgi:hypothetical protein
MKCKSGQHEWGNVHDTHFCCNGHVRALVFDPAPEVPRAGLMVGEEGFADRHLTDSVRRLYAAVWIPDHSDFGGNAA